MPDDPADPTAADRAADSTPTHESLARPDEDADPGVSVLREPADGLPAVVSDPRAYEEAVAALAAGTGPVAIDAERAHGFRYSQRAYLIQLRRHGTGTVLIDPIPLRTPDADAADLSELGEVIGESEWIIHAASQDLPCLAEVGLLPRTLFDTELAGRLLGYPRVNLGTLLEENFGVRLLKEHSAADWSTRPLPTDWLTYAALDVELLLQLRDALADQLTSAGKQDWARQEFAALAAGAGRAPEPRPEPWRRTSGIHRVRNRRGLAVVAELWQAREEIASRTDRAPGRILPDVAITDLAAAERPDAGTMQEIGLFRRRAARRYRSNWSTALQQALARPDSALPPLHRSSDGPPQQARVWASRDPVAAGRLKRARAAVAAEAHRRELPAENLLTPDHLRRVAWRPPEPLNETTVDAVLAESGARPWQRELVVGIVTAALIEPDPN